MVLTGGRREVVIAATGVVATLAILLLAATWTGRGASGHALLAALVLVDAAPTVVGWLAMALGLGCLLHPLLLPNGPDAWPERWALGLAAALTLDAAAGTLGLFAWGAPAGWLLLLVGAAGVLRARRDWRWPRPRGLGPVLLMAAPAIGVLLAAATVAPGWLWSTEFGGYDALSYHLPLPREWMHAGRIAPLDHSVYSALPGYVEASFLHLMVLRRDPIATGPACQLLHASITLLAAWITGRAAGRWWRTGASAADDADACARTAALAGSVAAVAVLATPWSVVVGSLAYNEMAVAALLAGSLLVIAPHQVASRPEDGAPSDSIASWGRGAAVGGLLAAACGAKLTAVGFAVVPVLGAAVVLHRWRALRRPALAGAVVAVAVLSPWLARNLLFLGNPVFPFLASLFGTAHWSPEQVAIFSAAHRPDVDLAVRLERFWEQVMRFGFGANPAPGEPWRPLWGVLPWIAPLLLAALSMVSPGRRRLAGALGVALLLQVVFWCFGTHLQSRFLVPAVVPAAIAVGLGVAAIAARGGDSADRGPVATVALAAAMLLWSLGPLLVFRAERAGAPAAAIGQVPYFTGDADAAALRRASPEEQRVILEGVGPPFMINHALSPGASVLLIGDATPWYHRRPVRYRTTWDRGPFSAAVRADPDPETWPAALRRDGITHVMVDPSMLQRWASSGWNDPEITPDRLAELMRRARLVHRFPGGRILVELPTGDASRPSASSAVDDDATPE